MRFKDKDLEKYVKLYSDSQYDEIVELKVKDWLKSHNYLTKEKFMQIGRWKTRRQSTNYSKNDEDLIKEVTRIAFSTENEYLKIAVLTLLKGVNYPVASAILHFKFPDRYPILDFRAIYSLGWKKPAYYNFDYWWEFVTEIRRQSKRLGVTIRELDKALWAYSRKHQPSNK